MSVKKFVAALSLLVLAVSTAQAATVVSGGLTGADTPGVAGGKTYTLVATSDAGKVIGFNFDSGGGSGFGLLGAMNQVNPFGQATVLNDTPDAIYAAAGSNILADSHFLVKSTDGIAVNAAESATSLTGAFNLSNTAAAPAAMTFAQVVILGTGSVQVKGQFTVETPGGNVLENVDTLVGIPEPGSFALAGLALIGGFASLRRRAA
jgi:hypothetical protein